MNEELNTRGPAPTLDAAQRKALKAQAHPLKPVVMIGESGLTPAVLAEIERALVSHELIKIRVFGDDREARSALHAAICEQTASAPVQHIGKLLVIWRPGPDDAPVRSAKGRAKPSAPYQPKKAAGAGQAAPTKRAPRTRPADQDKDTRGKPPAQPRARLEKGTTGRPTALARGAALGKSGAPGAAARDAGKAAAGEKPAPRAARKAFGAQAQVGKPARPGRAPALASPGARVRSPIGRKR